MIYHALITLFLCQQITLSGMKAMKEVGWCSLRVSDELTDESYRIHRR